MKETNYFFRNNLKFLRERRQLTQQELAEQLSMTRSKINALESGQTKSPSIEDLLKCADLFGISLDTFIRTNIGKLSELKIRELETGNDAHLSGSQLRILATTVNPDNEENIEMVPIKAKAGYLEGYGDPEFIRALPVFQLPFLPTSKKHRMFQTEGDSMLPIPGGSYIVGSFLSEWRLEMETPCIVVTATDGITFKLVTFQSGKRTFLLRSLNAIYSPYEVGAEEIRELWKFEYYLTPEFPSEALTLQQIGIGISEIIRKLDDRKK